MRALLDCESKICTVCKKELSITKFAKHQSCKGGHRNQCVDCVRERTRKWNAENQARRSEAAAEKCRASKIWAIEYMGGKCADCGKQYQPCVYQFHHLDPSQKDKNPSYLFSAKRERLIAELDKCVMLCANCHMIRHHGGED